ncbi:phosphoenolpyruvate--protein phosphotransferase [Burkholderia gladioli pv. gladioli]|uniref:phosphoenolpyruvate--protein phosphotransferase n=1 Tax=Burkholderia gladioli TaxID=28095 RepID=A0AAW3EYK5_BURGA|nr:phosphoenolpyruvate--protein phosphotransferase [Burkholderia gladioli]AJW95226.1 phosphoenolpyruvate-protein phosphotransferase [Burkholderia gladioli]ASD82909.1 phosphoenolpyruvate--protein phosphotransferase [Burkholderia gladioli pv. gladioli]AWY50345.1 phosphoenolpyruvate--protein phosphotransferase [Burkholderia gladioli pv. gladioli]KGC13142.1 phosphoenolpyruvate-protein phosphotransferase [Burkholderia gladioli]MDJ1164356.1 phosphoenolpyruvate--protein phosphotransferase [Burkholder
MSSLLTAGQVRLAARAASRHDAIDQAGALLVEAGVIEPAYVASLHGREQVSNTYLGHGVAIPHGLQEDRHLIRRTGVAVLQLPDGVEWRDGERARLVVAIAAQSDQHIVLLQRLTRLIGDPARLAELLATRDPLAIVNVLDGDAGAAPAAGSAAIVHATPADYAERVELVLDYPHGLHARPASAWVASAKRFQAALRVRHGDSVADPKNLVSLLQLGATANAELVLSAQGVDAAEALAALKRTIEALSAEEHARADAAKLRRQQAQPALWTPRDPATVIEGVGAGPGFVAGPVRLMRSRTLQIEDRADDPLDAATRLEAALASTARELEALARETGARLGEAEGAIFAAQRELLDDAALLDETARRVVDGHGLAWSWHRATEQQAAKLAALPDPLLAARAADLRDVARRVLGHLGDADVEGSADVSGDGAGQGAPAILIAEDLTPSDTAQLDPAVTLGFCTVAGGPTSHTAILARTMGVPAAVACGAALLALRDGEHVVLDGNAGRLYAGVSAADRERAAEAQRRFVEAQHRAAANRALPAATLDGHVLEIGANITRPAQVKAAIENGADGVGLMRTEFLFLERHDAPDEEEQYACYRQMVEASGGRHLIIRTLDIGGDKQVPYLNLPHESNPFLGVRGLRLCLRRPELFVPQLRALYRAAMHGPLWIMFPMVSTLDEARQAIALAETVRAELDAPKVPLGIMVETPSAAALADHFAELVDFFSIGTNDLTQYVLAIDREHPELARMAQSLHPAVLRMIAQTVDGARRHRKWVGVCGGLAGEPLGAAILAGLGVDELSMSVRDIPAVKTRLRASRLDALRALARRALDAADVDAVRALDGGEVGPAGETRDEAAA